MIREGGEDGGDGTVVRDIGDRLVGPDGVRTQAIFIKPFLAFLEVIGTTDEFETESVTVGLCMLDCVHEVGWLTT